MLNDKPNPQNSYSTLRKPKISFSCRPFAFSDVKTGTSVLLTFDATKLSLASDEFVLSLYGSARNQSNQYSNNALPVAVLESFAADGRSGSMRFTRAANDGNMICHVCGTIAKIIVE